MSHMMKVQNIQSFSTCENRVENKDVSNNFLQANADLLKAIWNEEQLNSYTSALCRKKYLQKYLNCLSQFSSHLLFPHSEGKIDTLPIRLQGLCDNMTNSRAAMC